MIELWKQQKGRCALTGRRMSCLNGLESVSIDRIDNHIGYHISNVRLVCWWANKARNSWSDTEFYDWCDAITRKGKGQ